MTIFFKVLAFIFAVLFVLSASLQLNDPDSLIWIIIWAGSGLLCLGFGFNKVRYPVLLGVGVIALGGFFYCYPEKFEGFEIGQGDIKNVEEAREAFGLLIISLVLMTLGLRDRFIKSKIQVKSST